MLRIYMTGELRGRSSTLKISRTKFVLGTHRITQSPHWYNIVHFRPNPHDFALEFSQEILSRYYKSMTFHHIQPM